MTPQEKRALLVRRLQEKAAQNQTALPLSSGQAALWFLHQQDPANPAYNTAFSVRLHTTVDAGQLQTALQKVVARHAALRTRFVVRGTAPMQIVHGYRAPQFTQVDARLWDEQTLYERVVAAYRKPFDLENDPLLRVDLFTRNDNDHVLLIAFHHIICDAAAIWQIVGELGQLLGEPNGTLPKVLPYSDFVTWQNEYVESAAGEKALAYWRENLAGELPTLAMLTDFPRKVTGTPQAASHFFKLEAGLLHDVQQRARELGTTPFVFLLTVYFVLLQRYTGQEDVIVGTPTAGRNRPNFRNIVGYLVNPIPLRAQLGDNPTFADLLQQVRQTVLGGLTHQDYPLPLLTQKLRVERGGTSAALFETFFVYQQPPPATQTWGGFPVSAYPIPQMEGQFDLHLELTQQTDGLTGIMKYNADSYAGATIERMMGHYERLLRGVLADVTLPIERVEMLGSAEKTQLLHGFNDTYRDYPRDVCLHTLFEQQVLQTPNAVALRFETPLQLWGRSLTYRELNELANQVAHVLRQKGVGANVLVGVAMERSAEMVIALYAILKAGGAYVPLDPTYPTERLAFMIADADVPLVLTQSGVTLPEISAEKLYLDKWHSFVEQPRTNPPPITYATDTAYMIYTSGSTGKPKGAKNAHRGIVNRLLWMQDEYGLKVHDRVLQKTPFSFDVSVWEFFWPLMTGATLIVARPEGHKDSRYLIETIERERITTLHFVPSMLKLFLDDSQVSRCTSLRRVICSGEALTKGLTQAFFENLSAELHNLYGPTEAAIDVTYWQCQPDDTRVTVPIGRPVANTQIYIVDKHDQPVPIGVAGELLIGGVQVGQGYHKRPTLTAERFVEKKVFGIRYSVTIPNTEYRIPNTVYRTGDLARWRADGTVEYLGRIDFQVKVRGFRIELGEVETVLMAQPAVNSAVVVAKQDAGGGHLVAYVVGDVDGLRDGLREVLPDHAIPSHFVTLDEIPLLPNGKVNRRALPEPKAARPQAIVYQAPQNSAEITLTTIWQEILDVEQVGIHDNFFDLGGHSLLLALVRRRVETAFECQLPLVDLFRYPTVHTLAQHVSGLTKEATPLVKEGRGTARQNRLATMRQRRRRR